MNVVELPVRNLADIPAMARTLADDVERGDYGTVRRVLVIMDSDDLHTFGWGDVGDAFASIGLLDAAKFTMLQAMSVEDE